MSRAWAGPSTHTSVPGSLGTPRTLPLSGPVAALVLVAGPHPPCPGHRLQPLKPTSAPSPGRGPALRPVTVPARQSHSPALSAVPPLHAVTGFSQKHKPAQPSRHRSHTLLQRPCGPLCQLAVHGPSCWTTGSSWSPGHCGPKPGIRLEQVGTPKCPMVGHGASCLGAPECGCMRQM